MKYLRPIAYQLPQTLTISVVMGIILTLGVKAGFLENITRESKGSSFVTSSDRALPDSVAEVVLQDASMQLSVPVEELHVISAGARSWSDSCLGLTELNKVCDQIVVSGWRVTVEDGQRRLIYRTNGSGSQVRLESSDLLGLARGKTLS